MTRSTNAGLRVAEDVIYAAVAVVLAAAALVVLVDAAHELVRSTTRGVERAMEGTLDSLLIVFILVELLGAVRATLAERKLIAEPFLLVGIIASIKEIVVAASFAGTKRDVEEVMLEVGVLGAIVLGLSLATFMLRRKEREPSE